MRTNSKPVDPLVSNTKTLILKEVYERLLACYLAKATRTAWYKRKRDELEREADESPKNIIQELIENGAIRESGPENPELVVCLEINSEKFYVNKNVYIASDDFVTSLQQKLREKFPFYTFPLVLSKGINKISKNEEAIENKIINIMTEDFKKIWSDKEDDKKIHDHHLIQLFENQLTKMDVGGILQKFYDYHPWIYNHALITEDVPYSLLAENFLKEYLRKKIKMQVNYSINCIEEWLDPSITILIAEILKPEAGKPEEAVKNVTNFPNDLIVLPEADIDIKDDINQFLSFPYQQVDADYCLNSSYFSFEKKLKTSRSYYSKTELYNIPPTRIDILRFLNKFDSEKMKASESTHYPEYLPFSYQEVIKGHVPWQALNIVFINICDDEHSPLWVVCRKENNKWKLYVPHPDHHVLNGPNEINLHDVIKKLGDEYSGLEHVDYKNNEILNDINDQTQVAKWHAVLFGRVFPWFKQSEKPKEIIDKIPISLSEYRDRVPLTLLHQIVQLQFLNYASPETIAMLPGISETIDRLKKVFMNYSPLSKYSMDELNKIDNFSYIQTTFTKNNAILEGHSPSALVTYFDEGKLVFSEDLKCLTINSTETEHIIAAMYVVYHSKVVTTLTLASSKIHENTIELFNYDTNIKFLKVIDDSIPMPPLNFFTARNRFFDAVLDSDELNDFKYKHNPNEIWSLAGSEMISFLKQNGHNMRLEWMNEYIKIKKEWKEKRYDYDECSLANIHKDPNLKSAWVFAQMTEMGKNGLDALFDGLFENLSMDKNNIKFSPHLDATFDLSDTDNFTTLECINTLIEKIKYCIAKHENHVPIFSSLSFILPENLNQECIDSLGTLFGLINSHKIDHPSEVSEINLYPMTTPIKGQVYPSNTPKYHVSLLDKLSSLANDQNFQMQINIPDWNRTLYALFDDKYAKAKYREIQNKIHHNQVLALHKREVSKLLKNQNIINSHKENQEKVAVPKEYYIEQYWSKENETYPLNSQPVAQHQQQQEQTTSVSATIGATTSVSAGTKVGFEKEHKQEYQERQRPIIRTFDSNIENVITRQNINDKYIENINWLNLKEKYSKDFPDITPQQFFSIIVGSHENADQVIEGIDSFALDKIIAHALDFKLGLSKDDLPAGFYLTKQIPEKDQVTTKGLILCFSETMEREYLEEIKVTPRDPFKIILRNQAPIEFHGDYRQFEEFIPKKKRDKKPDDAIKEIQTLWCYLATEDEDEKRIKTITTYAKKNKMSFLSVSDVSVTIQRQDVAPNNAKSYPYDIHACLWILKNWAHEKKASNEIIETLFSNDINNKTYLSETNLKAFGQLFNRYSINNDPNAYQQWLTLADKILKSFGLQHFIIWKENFLDRSKNWSEHLETEEIEAITQSIISLKNNPHHQEIWWKLVNAHGQSTQHALRYADLWIAFNEMIKFLENNKLNFNFDKMCKYLDHAHDFNAIVFLDRLFQVLVNATKLYNANEYQQSILNNVDAIDWRHNGFYYASNYEKYYYWDKDFDYTAFNPTSNQRGPTYQTTWSCEDKLLQPITHTLRFVSQNKVLTKNEFENLKIILHDLNQTYHFSDGPSDRKNNMILRIWSACIVMGNDNLDNIQQNEVKKDELKKAFEVFQKCDIEILDWVNQALDFNKILTSRLTVDFKDLALICQSLNDFFKHYPKIHEKKINPDEQLAFLNMFGHTRKVASLNNENVNKIDTLFLKRVMTIDGDLKNSFNDLLLDDLPWLLTSEKNKSVQLLLGLDNHYSQNAVIARFKKQLRSINFSKTQLNALPKDIELVNYFNEIANANSPDEADSIRKKIISDLINKGCLITDQHFHHRKLNADEMKFAKDFLNERMLPYFKQQNIVLCENLLERLTIKIDLDTATVKKAIEPLLHDLIRIDDKPYFDELGKVLSALVIQANKKDAYYSVTQLKYWLDLLINNYDKEQKENKENDVKTSHFPVPLLNAMITSQSSLLNSNLNALDDTFKIVNQKKHTLKNLMDIVEDQFPPQFKSTLVDMVMEGHDIRSPRLLGLFSSIWQKIKQYNTDKVLTYSLMETLQKILEKSLNQKKIISDQIIIFEELEKQNGPAKDQSVKEQIRLTDLEEDIFKIWSRIDSSFHISYVTYYHKAGLDKEFIRYTKLFNLYLDNKITNDLFYQFLGKESMPEMLSILFSHIKIAKKEDNTPTDIDFLDPEHTNEINELIDLFKNPVTKDFSSDSIPRKFLESWTNDDFSRRPFPTVQDLKKLLTGPDHFNSADDLFEHYELNFLSMDANGGPKYHYSIQETDRENISRVLNGIKIKGKGHLLEKEKIQLMNLLYYCNDFSQMEQLETLPMMSLKEGLIQALLQLKATQGPENTKLEEQSYAATRLLAYLRAIVLRKTGKWVNHTQMLDLIYAALHNDEKLIHQMNTGEGKSIITAMRVIYLALNGPVVDVFSAKESLPERDYKEFLPLFDCIGIKHSLISPTSSAYDYNVSSTISGIYHEVEIGAINYSTVSGMILFECGAHWSGQLGPLKNIDRHKRVAWLDEIDHILNDNTQSNFSGPEDGRETVYNYEEWVYRLAYDYYSNHRSSIIGIDTGQPTITDEDLKQLCEYLQRNSHLAPPQSTFREKYLIDAALPQGKNEVPNDQAVKKRNQYLKKLLEAAHMAFGLRRDIDFSVVPILLEKLNIKGRFAAVVIDNQVKEKSTYSNLVQQLLHVRLNMEAVVLNEPPTFFIEPDNPIIFSLNNEYFLNKSYQKIEGATATPGDEVQVNENKNAFDIDSVIKFPPHLPSKTEILDTEYCASEDEQIAAIVRYIESNELENPILITCENDAAVKHLSDKVKARLTNKDLIKDFFIDTNDSKKSESEAASIAGRKNMVTFSSRMGRGTDIKPEVKAGESKNSLSKIKAGLMVIRTYAALMTVKKQEQGRTGRNGLDGTCIDILDMSKINAEWKSYQNSNEGGSFKFRAERIINEERKRLDAKIRKHQHSSSPRWDWTKNPYEKECYLIARSLPILKKEIKDINEKYLHKKENLIAVLSGAVMDALRDCREVTERFHADWLLCFRQIESAWDKRLCGKHRDTPETYKAFLVNVEKEWSQFCAIHKAMGINEKAVFVKKISSKESPVSKDLISDNQDKSPSKSMPAMLTFYQTWLRETKNHLNKVERMSARKMSANDDMDLFYNQVRLFQTNCKDTYATKFFGNMTEILNHHENIYDISFKAMAGLFSNLNKISEEQCDYCLIILKVFLSNLPDGSLSLKTPSGSLIDKSQLLTIVMQLASTLKPSKPTTHFIVKYMRLLLANPKMVRDTNIADKIFALTGNNENILTLLYDLEKDQFAQVIELLNQGKHGSFQIQLANCQKYLLNFSREISAAPFTLIPILKLYTQPSRDLNKDLEHGLFGPNCLAKLDVDIQKKFWIFLTKRFTANSASYEKLISLILLGSDDSNFIGEVITPLLDLPPHIEINFITDEITKKLMDKLVVDENGQTDFTHIRDYINTLNVAGSKFNGFLKAKNFIENGDDYLGDDLPIKNLYDYNKIDVISEHLDCFNAMVSIAGPKCTDDFFDWAKEKKYNTINKDTFFALANFYIQWRTSPDWEFNLPYFFEIANIYSQEIKNVSLDTQAMITADWNKVLAEENFENAIVQVAKFKTKLDYLSMINDKKIKELAYETWCKFDISETQGTTIRRTTHHLNEINKWEPCINGDKTGSDEMNTLAIAYLNSISISDTYTNTINFFNKMTSLDVSQLNLDAHEVKQFCLNYLNTNDLDFTEERTQYILSYFTGLNKNDLNKSICEYVLNRFFYQCGRSIGPLNPEIILFYNWFINVISRINFDADLDRDTLLNIIKRFFGEDKNKIPNINELNQLSEILKTAVFVDQLERAENKVDVPENQNGASRKPAQVNYFDKFNTERNTRVKVMQYLNHNLLGPKESQNKFAEDYKTKYQDLAKTLPTVNDKVYRGLERLQLHHAYQELARFSKEMKNVAKPLFSSNPASSENSYPDEAKPIQNDEDPTDETYQKHQAYFIKELEDYGKFWKYKSPQRKAQANKLISELIKEEDDDTLSSLNRKEYYIVVLASILDIQREILKSDYNDNISDALFTFKQNTKGSSRLYDTCSIMFIKIAYDCLNDTKMSPKSKGDIYKLLQAQLTEQIDRLNSYYNNNHIKLPSVLKNALENVFAANRAHETWKPDSRKLKDLYDALVMHKNIIPSYLKYLTESIVRLTNFSYDTLSSSGNKTYKNIYEKNEYVYQKYIKKKSKT